MSDYHDVDDGITEAVDQRPWLITACFFAFCVCSSLSIFIMLENNNSQSFVKLHHEILAYSKSTAAALLILAVVSITTVIAVWIQHRRLLVVAGVSKSVLIVALILVIVFVASLAGGTWDSEIRSKFLSNNKHNMTCPRIDHHVDCCGWNTSCSKSVCGSFSSTCKDTIDSEIRDFVVRVIPMVAFTVVFALVSAALIPPTLKKWDTWDNESNPDSFDDSSFVGNSQY